MRRFALPLALALLALPAAAFAQTDEEAGDVSEVDKDRQGPLRERVRPVSGHLFQKKGRFELSPSASLSLNDAFFTKYIFGATVGFFPTEALGIHLRVGYGLPVVAGSAQICTTETTGSGTTRGCNPPTFDQLDGRAPGQLRLLGGLDVQYAPLYGKVGLVAERFLHFDLYGLAGVSAVGYNGPTGATTGSKSYMTVGGNVGVGARIVATKWMTIRTELRDLIYLESVQPLPATSLRNQLLFELGFSFFLPTNFIPE